MTSRRKFIQRSSNYALGLGFLGLAACSETSKSKTAEKRKEPNSKSVESGLNISLAQWSLHQAFFDKKIDHLDFAEVARKEFDIEAVEYVNSFFKDKATNTKYLNEMIKRADDNGVESLLIMVDGEGDLGISDEKERKKAVENHFKWINAAFKLGCHSIRVNAFGNGDAEATKKANIKSLRRLATYASKANINILVENHGGFSSNGQWLNQVISKVNLPNCGILPDFGNFCLKRENDERWGAPCTEEYDKYKGVQELMYYAKAVSAKSYDFDEKGNETTINYEKMIKIIKNGGYKGYIGVEYEGKRLSEYDGVKATKALLERFV